MHNSTVLSLMTSFRPLSDDEFLVWPYIREATHIAFYTVEAIRRIAEQCGLRLIYIEDTHYAALMTKEGGTDL